MKALIKLAVVALLANAAYRVGSEYLTFYRFRDAVQEATIYGPRDEAGLRKKVMELAGEYGVPLDEDDLVVQRQDRTVHVEGSYDRTIEVVPQYARPWHFAWALDVTPARAWL